jgi:hypothetical protein
MPSKVSELRGSQMSQEYDFDIALSFAGEDRAFASQLAELLQSEGVRVFYDEFQKSTLWGKDLYQHLQIIYKDKARYCIIFMSEHYANKLWTKHELRQTQARSFVSHEEYILRVRLDDAELPGVLMTIGYIDWRTVPIEQITALTLEKLGIKGRIAPLSRQSEIEQ